MTMEQIGVTIAFGLLIPLTAAYWYLAQRQSKRKKHPGVNQSENS